jgi:hypothetical protein
MTTKEYEIYGNDLAKKIDGIVALYEILPKNLPRTVVIQVMREDGSYAKITKQQLKEKRRELLKEIRKDLPKRFREAKKRSKKIRPEDFKNVYTPIVVADAIRTFVRTENFGYKVPNDPKSGKLLKDLQMIKKGYGLRNSFQLLWYICIYANDLAEESDRTMIRPSDPMKVAFSEVKACYCNELGDDDQIVIGPNDDELSSFEVIEYRKEELESNGKPFDREKFKSYYFSIILSINTWRNHDLSNDEKEHLARSEIREKMLEEFYIIHQTKELWKEITQKKKIEDSINPSSEDEPSEGDD